jgi:hypothetical protein
MSDKPPLLRSLASNVPLGPADQRGASFHGVWMSIEVLLIECRGCNRRSALDPELLPAIHRGNQTYVRDTKFKCRKSGPTPVRSYIPLTQDEVDMFLAGDPLPPARRVT